eukprot:m.49003 g.49003  ORF g.49003 m.49003 type:complete len:110 (+) comp15286_c0_seq1:146-475(+)
MPREVHFEEAAASKHSNSKAMQTGRYDPKAIKIRIDIEGWVDESLSSLYGVDTVDADHEIDLDYVLEHDTDADREKFIRNLLAAVPKENHSKIDAFVTELLQKVKKIKK